MSKQETMQASELVLRKSLRKSDILTALSLKEKLKGSVVWECVDCGKRGP